MPLETLPLLSQTPDSWAESVMTDICSLLDDHAHLERKAASNAMDLINRWPEPAPPMGWVTTLAAIARGETDHLYKVSRILAERGRQLTRIHKNHYASALRNLIRMGDTPHELVDRLLVSALIELRSCERFEILARCCPEPKLARLYKLLWGSEHNHFKVFLRLSRPLGTSRKAVDTRWRWMLEREAEILAQQPPGPRLHSSG